MIESNTCKTCRYFALIYDANGTPHPQGIGNCCVNPPTAVPAMSAPTQLVGGRATAQPVTMGLDPPVAPTRRACRHYSREFMDA